MATTISLVGCDDETIINEELTPEELAFLTKLQIKINKTSTFGCMPRLRIDDSYGPTKDDIDYTN